MNGFRFGVLALATLCVLAVWGCGDKDDDEGDLITLSEVVPDPVPVQLIAPTGVLTFDFSAEPLDVAEAEELLTVLTSGAIGLVVSNTDTGVSYNLLDGTSVTAEPAAPGEYLVTATEDGTAVTVEFYNEFDGVSIHTAATYSAAVEVIENGHFTVESFTRGVTVTE